MGKNISKIIHPINPSRNIPTHLSGIFTSLYTDNPNVRSQKEYAVFTDVRVMNKIYKKGSCKLIFIRSNVEGLSSPDGSSFSNTIITQNEDREVFFDDNWVFGLPKKHEVVYRQVITKIEPKTIEDIRKNIGSFHYIPFRIEDSESIRHNPFISDPKGGRLNENWYKLGGKTCYKKQTYKGYTPFYISNADPEGRHI